MSIKKFLPSNLFILLIGIALFLSSCQRNSLKQSTKTSNSIHEVDDEMRKMSTQIEVTATSLDKLMKADAPDFKNDFDTYSENLNKLRHQGKIVINRVDDMKSNSKEYFAEWEKQEDTYTNPKIRGLSEQRRNKLEKSYNEVRVSSIGIKEAYLTYQTDLDEIHSYLANDLTPEGIKALRPVTDKANDDLRPLKKSFNPMIEALNDIREQMYHENK